MSLLFFISRCWLGHLTCRIFPDMTYNVFGDWWDVEPYSIDYMTQLFTLVNGSCSLVMNYYTPKLRGVWTSWMDS